jgi:hypothetical protein
MTTGPTPWQRREIERLLERGAKLPDVDWDTLPAQRISRILSNVKEHHVRTQAAKRAEVRRRIWATGDGLAAHQPRRKGQP